MAKQINDNDLIVISGGAGFHVAPEPNPGIPPSIGQAPGDDTPGGPGPGPEAQGGSSGGNQNLTK